MKTCGYFLWALSLALLVGLGCAANPAATPAPATAVPKDTATQGPSAVSDWDKTVAEARKEGQLLMYNASTKYEDAAARFKQKYGIVLDSIALNSGQIAERMSREYNAGIHEVDVISTGTGGVRLLKPLNLMAPLEDVIVLPEVLDATKWVENRFPLVDHFEVDYFGRVSTPIWVNTDMVKPGDIKEMRDLLKPEWKGKVILDDPQNSGAGTQWFRMYYPLLGDDFMTAFVKQEPVVLRDKRLEVEWLARGKYPVLIGGNYENLLEFKNLGSPIAANVTKEGKYIGPGSGIIEMAPKPAHPNAAKLFVNWILTQEGQTLLTQQNLIPSRRLDVPTAHLSEDEIPKKGETYLADTPESLANANDFMKQSAKLFAPVLK